MVSKRAEPKSAASREGAVLTKATIRASEKLGVSQKALGNIIGLSEPVVSRMKNGEYVLARGKPFELAALFVRLYRSLDAIVGGDEPAARKWMKNRNLALNGAPIDLVQKVYGLTHVVQYLDSRRAVI
ncbi:MbcA/ParS/Xre antitoxin family protein [Bradyrhizobium sp.]|uniref:MbcA/ParS/Xre antitoxin family protein n=1 Tax=Bradyrhizobium sp. TaxID=376 RepID=UPI0040381260